MPRYVIQHPDTQPPLTRNEQRDGRLVENLVNELENAYSARRPQEQTWIEADRQYAGLTETPVRNQPIPNAPNIELPTGALIADSLYAQVTDTLYQGKPVLTVRAMDGEWEPHAKDLQKLVTWMCSNEIGMRFATDTSFQDDIKLGTGILYCPWVKEERVTKTARIVATMPRMFPISPEDFCVPVGSRGDHQQDEWCNVRTWYTPGEFASQARGQKWGDKAQLVKPQAMQDARRLYYARMSRQEAAPTLKEQVAIENTWVYFDYMNDGVQRDLQVAWDRASRTLLHVGYNRTDTRPIETMRYQIRPHLFWGLGVMEMVQPFQKAGTDVLNHFLLNMMLVNGRMYVARDGTITDFTRVWPMKVIPAGSPDDIKELKLSDVYPSALAGLQQVISLAERRVGVTGDFTSGNPATRVLGTRTPGITAMTALQGVNRRFAPAFDGMRLNAAAAVRQCVWRYAERVRMDDRRVKDHLIRLLGEPGANRVFELFRQDDFERCVAVEFTAISASVNAEADRQNAMLLMQQQGAYIQQVMQALMQMVQPGTDKVLVSAAKKALNALNYTNDLFVRTFDQVRSPERMQLDVLGELDVAEEQAEENAAGQAMIGQVVDAISGGGAGGAGGDPLAALLGGASAQPGTPPGGPPEAEVAVPAIAGPPVE